MQIPVTVLASGTSTLNVQDFTASGTWTKPSGVTYVRVVCVGGGGGGTRFGSPGSGGRGGDGYVQVTSWQ